MMERTRSCSTIIIVFCSAIVFFSYASYCFGGTIVTLETDFDTSQSWFKLSSPSKIVNAENNGKVLYLPAEAIFQTPNISTMTALAEVLSVEMVVAADGHANASVSVIYLDADGKKEVGRAELPDVSAGLTPQRYNHRIVLKCPQKLSHVSRFRVLVRTKKGGAPLLISRFKVSTHTDKLETLMEDPGFEHALNYDCWFALKGQDWDGLKYHARTGEYKRVKENVISGKHSLKLSGPAVTLRSKRIIYGGERIYVSTWFLMNDIRFVPEEKPAGWASSAVQIVGYDKNGKEVGHQDVVLERGTRGWEHRYAATRFNKGVKYVEVLIRHFPGIRGTSWYDGTVVLMEPIAANSIPYNPEKGTLTVDVSKSESSPIRPIWLNTDAVWLCEFGDRNYRAQMREICDEIPMEMIRIREIMNVSPDLVQVDKDGNLVHNWKALDANIDFLVNDLKVKLLITPETTPDVLAIKQTRSFCNRYVPRDYALYQKALENVVCHFVERYGKETVGSWYWDIWNEPTCPKFFFGSKEEYAKVVLHFYKAMKNVERKTGVNLNLMTSSSAGAEYLIDLHNLNKAGYIKDVDGISYHGYAGMKVPMSYFERLQSISDQAKKDYGLPNAKVFNTELNGNTMPDLQRDTEIGAAFAVKAVRWYLDQDIDRLFWFCAACRSCEWRWGGSKPFNGAFYLMDYQRIRMPVFNSLKLLSRLIGGKRIPVVSTNDPFDAIAVRMPNGQIRVIVTTYDEDFASSQNRPSKVRIEFKGINEPLKCKDAFLVDKEHSIAIDDYRKMGSPGARELTQEKFDLLRKASLLEKTAPPLVKQNGELQYVELRFVGQSVWMGDFDI